MPDHLRQPKNAMGPRSPAGSDSPLSLVIGRRDHLELIHNKTPPPPPFHHEGSSGFSEGESPNDSPRRPSPEDDEQPLSLVVPKKNYDSGHDTEESSRSPKSNIETKEENGVNNLIKIKDFAKFNLGEDAREKMPPAMHREEALLAALTAPPKAKPVSLPGPSIQEDAMSEVSSMSSMSDLIQAQRIGDHTVYPCDFCDKVFGNKYHLASHLVTHTGEKSFECKFCQKSFGRRSTLRAHMTTHTKTSNFMCPLCEKACNDNNSLEEHIRMHTGEKPFVCTICAKAYARKSHLNVHYRVHTGERPFVCMSCGKDFTEKRFLNDHMQTAHSGNDGPLKCPNCFREFAYKTSLKQHLKKQMCAKNLNRGQAGPGSTNQGVHAKQFACPFCEKSYSWKQTLKQHVSMYHRNKVHTDEFWKYELAKHRRTVLDSKTNEDMWKKQLGKHASEQEQQANEHRSRSLEVVDRNRPDNLQDDRWLEQIKRSTSSDPNQNSQVAAEMKLLALHSLQSSLQMMSMKLPQQQPQPPATPEAKPPSRPKTPSSPSINNNGGQQGYLTLLAHLSAQRKAEDSQKSHSETSAATSLSIPSYLSDMKEESAAKRTQMWLAQLGQYRQKSIQEDFDRNHEELWEEQIAKVKQNPIKSPLEPIEITIEDNEDNDIRAGCRALLPPPPPPQTLLPKTAASPPSMKRPPTPVSPIHQSPTPNVISIKTSAIQRVENQPRTFSLSLEVNNNSEDPQEPQRHIPVPLLPTSRPPLMNPPPVKRRLLEIPEDEDNLSSHDHEEKTKELEIVEKKPEEDGSVLKSLLMDRLPRKRPLSPSIKTEAKRLSFCSSNGGGESDILRRRLLGIKSEDVAATAPPQTVVPVASVESLPPKPKFQPPTATITSQQLEKLQQHQSNAEEGQSSPVDLRKEDKEHPQIQQQQPQPPMKNYTQTSVLKHLLYRYTSSGNTTEDESSSS